MEIIERGQLERILLPGRAIQTAVGKDAFSKSSRMTMGYARYSAETGPMEPHHHAEEIVYIISADRGWIRSGPEKDQLGDPIPLRADMTVHIPPLEWHVFEYDEGGHLDILFFYGQVDNIRPEDIEDK
jgi:mannose-6-phosphate isomerase-like protein (cupin superfamily)